MVKRYSYRLYENDTHDIASGPSRGEPGQRSLSPRDYRMPTDLTRSRRVGLSRTVCVNCAAVKDQGLCRHASDCDAPGEWMKLTTGPLRPDQTSKDVGWDLAR